MNFLKIQGGILSFLFLTSCTGYAPLPYQNPYGPQYPYGQNFPSTGQPLPYPPRTEAEYDERLSNDPDRDRILEESRLRNSGSTCGGQDREHECREQCKEMYRRRTAREDCEELATNQIQRLAVIHEILKEADYEDLDEIDLKDFEVYLNVSIAAFDAVVGRYSRGKAKKVLTWITESEDVSKLIQKEDDDYETLGELLESLVSFADDELEKPFTKVIEGNDRLFEIAIEADNEIALEWFQEYIFETDSACESEEISEGCFTVICKIGEPMDDDYREAWLDFDEFQDYIGEIIDEDINGANWADTIEDVDDIPSDDFINLCTSLI